MAAEVIAHHELAEIANVAALVGSGALGWLVVWVKSRRTAWRDDAKQPLRTR